MGGWLTTESGRKVKINAQTLAKATRLIEMNPRGTFSCYEGQPVPKGENWKPKKVGTASDITAATLWLKGQNVTLTKPPRWVRLVDRFR